MHISTVSAPVSSDLDIEVTFVTLEQVNHDEAIAAEMAAHDPFAALQAVSIEEAAKFLADVSDDSTTTATDEALEAAFADFIEAEPESEPLDIPIYVVPPPRKPRLVALPW